MSALTRRLALSLAALAPWAVSRPGLARQAVQAHALKPLSAHLPLGLDPDAALADIADRLSDAETRLIEALRQEDATGVLAKADAIDDEITALVDAAESYRPISSKGFSNKAWIVLAYRDFGEAGDRVFRSLMVDLFEKYRAERGRA